MQLVPSVTFLIVQLCTKRFLFRVLSLFISSFLTSRFRDNTHIECVRLVTRRIMTGKCRSQVFPRSAGSCEILLQHYLYIFSKRKYKLKADKTRTYVEREKGNMRRLEQEQPGEGNNEALLFDEISIDSFRRAIGRESVFNNNDALFVFHRQA